MTKLADVVKDALAEPNTAVKDIKQSDEEDLQQLAAKFDQLSEKADRIAARLSQADQALAGNNNRSNEQTDDESEEVDGDTNDQ